MKLVSFSTPGGNIRPGALVGDIVVDLNKAGYADALAAITAGLTVPPDGPTFPLAQVKLHAPIANPPRIFAIGLNYRDHAIESKMELPKTPVIFFKLQTAIIGQGDAIVLPRNSTQPDYEAELAFVIGKGGFRIPGSAWREHVYGYTIINDVSARDVQLATSQWSMGKSFPTFCPMGPAIVTADEVPDPHTLAIGLSIDGEVLQNSNTRELIFRIPDLIEYISSIAPLLPGDIVSTGTPSGVGLGRKPQRWLKPGETVTVTIQGLGSLTNPVVAE
ncbi:MAG: fumarylacetoacetate hydrolase family protein [Acidobacteriota bacterium]|jgi:2-keto-4-pentenoate hydratase/2-oxohepta-3-ene-1,7-dioic acid hydratase in catechol pathway